MRCSDVPASKKQRVWIKYIIPGQEMHYRVSGSAAFRAGSVVGGLSAVFRSRLKRVGVALSRACTPQRLDHGLKIRSCTLQDSNLLAFPERDG